MGDWARAGLLLSVFVVFVGVGVTCAYIVGVLLMAVF
jgi:hypothetical protein